MTNNLVAKAVGMALLGALVVSPVVNAEGKTAQDDVIAIGPVEVIEAGQVTVLGRVYKTEDLGGATAGDKAAVHGVLLPDGSVQNVHLEALGSYDAGSDQIYESGVVTKVNEVLGRVSIGDTEIDYTPSLASGASSPPAVGDMIAVMGTQPAPGGMVLGDLMARGPAAVVTFRGMVIASQGGSNTMKESQGGSNAWGG